MYEVFTFVWSWVVSWVFGWGGIAALVAAALWLAWFFVPVFKTQLLHLAIAATVFAVASTYFYSKGYTVGYDAAVAAMAREDQEAIDAVNAGRKNIADCRAANRTWDVVTGTCK